MGDVLTRVFPLGLPDLQRNQSEILAHFDMLERMDKPSCQSCQFFTKPAANSTAYGDCVRYPTPVTHLETHWCGEYKPRAEQFKEPAKRKA